MEPSTAITVFAAIFFVAIPVAGLFLQKEQRQITSAWTCAGIILAYILALLLPQGATELAIFSALFGVIVSFYKVSEDKLKISTLGTGTLTNIYRVLSGIFFFLGVETLYSLSVPGPFSIGYIAMIPLALIIAKIFAERTREFSPALKIFSMSFLLLSLPAVYQPFADFMDFLIHEVVHLNYVTFMFPDHPFLDPAFYQTSMNTIFNPAVTGFGIFALVILLSIAMLRKTHWRERSAGNLSEEVEIRKWFAGQRRTWRTFLIATLSVGLVMFGSAMSRMRSEQGFTSEIYPVQAEGGIVTLSMSKPLYQIGEGKLRKYKYDWNGQSAAFILFRWQGQLKVVMDFCEFCESEKDGYLFKNGQLLCGACQTAIDPATLGIPGGCNPVPLPAEINEYVVKIKVADLIEKFESKKALK